MTSLSGPLQPKRSTVSGEVPLQSELVTGEIAINTADGKLYTKHSDGSVIDLSSGIGSTGVSSVNGQAGAVTLGITDLSDVEQTNQGDALVWSNYGGVEGLAQVAGEWIRGTNDPELAYFHISDDNGDSYEPFLDGLTPEDEGAPDTVQFSVDGGAIFQAALLYRNRPENNPPYFAIQATGFDFGNVSSIQVATGAGDQPVTRDGDVIQYVESEGVYKNQPLPTYSTVATTGSYNDLVDLPVIPQPAVDSVNGKTGAVSLSLYDLSNVSASLTGDTWENYLGISGAPEADSPDGSWVRGSEEDRKDEAFLSLISHSGIDFTAFVQTLQAGDEIPYEKDGVIKTATFLQIDTSAPVTYWSIKSTDSTEVFDNVNFPDGIRLTTIPGPGATDGQVLTYDESDNTFKPAQLPAGSGAVDSVNGETGVISLGIQDMDDFKLNDSAPSTAVFTAGNYNEDANANPGKWTANGSTIYIKFPDRDGQDLTGAFAAHDYSQGVYVSTDGDTWTQITGTTKNYTNNGAFGIDATNWGPFQAQVAAQSLTDPLYISLTAVGVSYSPLAEGDILQWSDSYQKFKPAQLPADADTKRIQDMDDFRLKPDPNALIYRYDTPSCSASSSATDDPGECSCNSDHSPRGGRWAFCNTDSQGYDFGAEVQALEDAGPTDPYLIWFSGDGQNWFASTTRIVDRGSSYCQMYLENDQVFDNCSLGNAQIYVTFVDPTNGVQSIPLTEGDILQWVDADQTFKPAQLSGAVESINGETGVVSLGIQEMDDYEPNFPNNITWLIENSGSHVSGMPPGEGYVSGNGSVNVSPIDALGTDRANNLITWIATLSLPTIITFKFDGIEYPATVTGTSDQSSDTGAYRPRISFSFASDPFSGDKFIGQVLDIVEFNSYLGITGSPLAEGDILQWNSTVQKFKPAQLTAAPVNSVNGETGVVSLGIQEMNDFELVVNPPATTTWIGKWEYSATADNNCQADTFIGRESNGGIMSRVDIDGNDLEATVTGIANGSTLYVRVNSGSWQQLILDAASSTGCVANLDSFNLESTVLKTVLTNATAGDLIEISDGTDSATDVQLADGDVLQWVDADQKFKPAALADNDTKRIQDMDDFELKPLLGSVSFTNRVDNAGDLSGPGDCVFNNVASQNSGDNFFQWHSSLETLDLMQVGDDITFSSPGLNDFATTVIEENVAGDFLRVTGVFPQEFVNIPLGAVSITVSSTRLNSGFYSLAEGDILQWDDAGQKFRPARLTEVGLGIEEAPEDGTPYVRQDADWVSAPSGGGGATDLDGLSDVTVSNPGDGQMIAYSASTGEWLGTQSLIDWDVTEGDPYGASVTFLGTYDTTLTVGGVTPAIAGTVTTTAGKFGNAATFDGSSHLQYGSFSAVDMPSDFTIDFWVKVDGTGEYGLVAKRNQVGAGSGTWGIITGPTGWSFQDLQSITVFAGTILTVGQWHHLAVVRSGTQVSTYTDGVLDVTANCTTNFTTGEVLRVGNWDVSLSRQLLGQIDDLRITPGIVRYTGASFTPPTASADSVVSLSGGLPLGNLSDVSLALPSDGDLLTYDNSSSEWVPGTVGIQDMDDFAYDREVGFYSGNTDKKSGGFTTTPGEWNMGSSPGFSYFSWQNSQSAAMDTLVDGTAITFSSPGLSDHSTTVVGDPKDNDSNSRYVELQDEWPQEYIDAPDGTPLVVTAAPLPSLPIQPPVAGSVLQWNEVDQKFTPAQPPAAPVDSVNGETGVVSLGIQDMDDFGLNPANAYRFDGYAGNGSAPGAYGVNSNSFQFNEIDSNGNNCSAVFAAVATPFTVYYKYSADDVPRSATCSTMAGPDSNGEIILIVDAVGGVPGSSLIVSLADLSGGGVPLIDGDILQWDAALNKFKPAQAKDRIQDMDDFELAYLGGVSFTNRVEDSVDILGPSYCRFNNFAETSGSNYFSWHSSLSTLDALQVGDDITFSSPGLTDFVTTVSEDQEANNYLRVAGKFPQEFLDIPLGATSITVSSSRIASGSQPLFQDDILRWSDTDQKFKPVQLPEVINKAKLQAEVAASADFADFQARIAAL